MWIDAREPKRQFKLTETELTEMKELFSKLRLVSKSSTAYGRYIDSSITPVLLIHKCDKKLLVMLVTDEQRILHCPRLIASALDDMNIDVVVGKGALRTLNRYTSIFKRLQFHKCI